MVLKSKQIIIYIYIFVQKKTILKNESKIFYKILTLRKTINLEELKEFTVKKELRWTEQTYYSYNVFSNLAIASFSPSFVIQ